MSDNKIMVTIRVDTSDIIREMETCLKRTRRIQWWFCFHHPIRWLKFNMN